MPFQNLADFGIDMSDFFKKACPRVCDPLHSLGIFYGSCDRFR